MIYPYKVYRTQVENHLFWIAECSCLKGCVGQGDTLDSAIKELEENETVWLETARECDIPIPEVPVETTNEFSGKFTVRVAPYVHKTAALHAKEEGVSLNQYVNDAIVEKNAKLDTLSAVKPEVDRFIDEVRERLWNDQPTLSEGYTLFSRGPLSCYSKRLSSCTESKNEHCVIPVNVKC